MNNTLQELIIYRDHCEQTGQIEVADLLDRVIAEMRRLLEFERITLADRL